MSLYHSSKIFHRTLSDELPEVQIFGLIGTGGFGVVVSGIKESSQEAKMSAFKLMEKRIVDVPYHRQALKNEFQITIEMTTKYQAISKMLFTSLISAWSSKNCMIFEINLLSLSLCDLIEAKYEQKKTMLQNEAKLLYDLKAGVNPPLFTEEELVTIMEDTMAGLHFLHNTLMVIHRDIKPYNIIFKRNGHSVISDFGLSVTKQQLE